MHMELAVHPDDASRLSRSKQLIKRPSARTRYRSVHFTWHDSPGRDLRAAGLALEEQTTGWRLERLTPRSAAWLPAQPAPEIASGRAVGDLGYPLPEALAPIATFDGRLAMSLLDTPGGSVAMAILRGEAGGHPICRLTLDGPDIAVGDVAVALAAEFRAIVPRASLAAEAIGRATGEAPAARRLGAPRPADHETVPGAFAHAMGHFTDVLGYYAPLAVDDGPDTEPVHQMRVAVRRARSALSAFQHGLLCPDVVHAGQDLKALGAVLGPTRDWDVFVAETLPPILTAFPDDGKLKRLAAAAEARRAEAHAALRAWLVSPAFRQLCLRLAWLSGSDSWHATLGPGEQAASSMTPSAFAAHVLQRRWKKISAAGKSIETLDVPSLHALRLRAKRARYAMEIFLPRDNARPAARLIRRLSVLQQHLGTLNDASVAAGMLEQLGGANGRHGYATGIVLGYLAASAHAVRPHIVQAWEKFRRTSRFWT